jgi:hypothetical protein
MDNPKKIKKLKDEIKQLEEEIEDRMAASPAHSFKPSIMQEIEDLEERLQEKREELERSRLD